MGVPTLFRHLFESYGYEIIKNGKDISCDYLFFDFNSVLYNVYAKNIEENQNKSCFIENIYLELKYLCETMNPKKFIGIYFDGVAPRAKMVQQRSRRYKSILFQQLLNKKDEFPITNYICPGTEFMQDLCIYLEQQLPNLKKHLSHKPYILLSSVNIPGEGEHKIMSDIRKFTFHPEGGSIVVMSPDNDLISLLMLNHNKNIILMRYMDLSFQAFTDADEKLTFISIDMIKSKFQKENSMNSTCMEQILLDYNFLLSICGNDFVMVFPFMRIKNGGIDRLVNIYKEYQGEDKYLIDKDNNLSLNTRFFKYILIQLAKSERFECRKWGSFIEREKRTPDFRIDNDESLSKIQKKEAKINHLYLCNENHPLYEIYAPDFESLNFQFRDDEFRSFKNQYYHYFLKKKVTFFEKKNMVEEYLKSLKFTLLYYNKECPSYTWFYPYRCAPFFSDILFILDSGLTWDSLVFSNSQKKYKPYEQLMMILPKESSSILPNSFVNVFSKYKYNYPSGEYRVDALQGMKFIYSEVILPEWKYLPSLLQDIKKLENTLSEKEKQRNQLIMTPFEC